ncbi:unnamed protein product [Hapterophycus canaliculatus]
MDVAVKELKTCIASAAAVAAASPAASEAAGGGGAAGGGRGPSSTDATAGTGAEAVVGRGGVAKARAVNGLIDGRQEMRHEAEMLAKG